MQKDGRRFRSGWRRLTASVALVVILWVLLHSIPVRRPVAELNPFRSRANRPLVIAHAGGLGLHPGNTLPAFAASVALGCDLLEMDVRLARDGVLVTHHDATVDRTSHGTGAVLDLSVAELKALDFGAHFRPPQTTGKSERAALATLDELFQLYPTVGMIIEIKDRGEVGRRAAAELARLIRQYRREARVLVASFDDATLEAFRRFAGDAVPTSTAKAETRQFVILRLLGLANLWSKPAVAFQVPSDPKETSGFDLTSASFLAAAHARNVGVHYWTVNSEEEMRRLMALGADGLITDFPDRLLGILRDTPAAANRPL